MSTTPFLEVIGMVQQRVPKCPENTVVIAYRDAVRRFCGQSRWLRQRLTGTITAGTAVYSLGSDPQLEIVDVPAAAIYVTVGSNTQEFGMKPSDPGQRDPNAPQQRPFTYSYIPESTISFYYTPDQTYQVLLTLALQPTENASEIDDTLLPKWFSYFEAGALSHLLMLPEPWRDPRAAADSERYFLAGLNNAKTDVARGYQSGTVMVKKRAWIVS